MLAACTNAKQKLPKMVGKKKFAADLRGSAGWCVLGMLCVWATAGCTMRGAGWRWPEGATVLGSSTLGDRIGLVPDREIEDTWSADMAHEDRLPAVLSAPAADEASDPPVAGWPEAWNAVAPERPWRWIVLHHSGTERGTVASIDREHRRQTDRNGQHWLGIGYHFVIGNGQGMDDGAIQPTFRWKQQLHGAHAGSEPHNESGIGICLIGNFEDQPPTAAQQQAATQLIELLAHRYQLPRDRVVRHGDLKRTECPGHHFPFEAIVGREPAESVEVRRDIRAAWRGEPLRPVLR